MHYSPIQKIKTLVTDAILWKAQKLKDNTNGVLTRTDAAINEICKTISLIPSEFVRDRHIEKVAPIFGAKPAVFIKVVKNLLSAKQAEAYDAAEEEDYLFPKFMGADHKKEMMLNGFSQVYEKGNRRATGIHIALNDKRIKSVSNFVLEPLYLVTCQDPADNKQLFIVRSATQEAVIEFQRSSVTSVERFRTIAHAKHNFIYSGNIDHLLMIMQNIGEKVPTCEEVTILGWQPEGFFAYPDKFYSNGALLELNEYGIAEHNGHKYFSPSRSILYKHARQDDNIYQQLASLNYKKSPITFTQWADLMDKTYPGNGKYAILFVFICLFRDVVLKKDGSCPHLYVWGAPGSGKSKMMESLASLFYNEARTYQLNSGTDFGLSRFVEIFRNCFNFINELDEETVKPQWLQWIKGWYDNEGRAKGTGKKNMTEIMKCNSAVGLAGQKIVNGDNNALPQRCIVLEFKSLEKQQIPAAQMDAYNKLKKYEENGGFNSLLTEILAHRETFKTSFDSTFNELFIEVRADIKKRNLKWHERIARNYCYMLAMAKVAEPIFTLPFKYEELYNEFLRAIDELAVKITSTDVSSAFWRVVSYLADKGDLISGLHYKIKVVTEVELYGGTKGQFQKPTKVLMLRLEYAHTAYLNYIKREGATGMNRSSLESYLKNKEYWVGPKNKEWFEGTDHRGEVRRTNSSSFVFNYELLAEEGIQMEFESVKSYHQPNTHSSPQIENQQHIPLTTPQEDLPF